MLTRHLNISGCTIRNYSEHSIQSFPVKTPDKRHRVYIGLCSTYHDPALAIVSEDGAVLYAEATERFLQYKRALNCEPDNLFQLPGILDQYCRNADEFVIAGNWHGKRPPYEKIAQAFRWLEPEGILNYSGRQLTSLISTWELNHMQACQFHAMRRSGINLARTLRQHHSSARIGFRHFDHHHCHAALACHGSPFDEASCAVIDSYGERGSLAFFRFSEGRLTPIHMSRGPQSLGFFYMKLTELCGFDWMGGEEWKVMGLASYGEMDPQVKGWLEAMMKVRGLDIHQVRKTFFANLDQLETQCRQAPDPPESVANLAFTGQQFFTDTVNELMANLYREGQSRNLALGGGCALNSVCNGQILNHTPFDTLYVPSAPADDGTALGAALLAWSYDHPDAVLPRVTLSPYLGSCFNETIVERFVRFAGLPVIHLPDGGIINAAARLLSSGKIIGWVQGRAEYGPRALGNRSILADPRSRSMMDKVNRVVKFRERFRPYAPSILHEYGHEYFENYQESPYMERTLRFRASVMDKVPGVVHVDGTGRLQTVKAEWNPRFHALLEEFRRLTGIPVLMNTSFNVMGKPIVHGIEDAFAVFMGSGLDCLIVEDYLFTKPDSIE